jgi:hypothetical protein
MTSEVDKNKILGCLSEISNSFTRIEGEREQIKEIIDKLKEEHAIDKKIARKLAKTYHKRNFEEEVAQQNDFVDLWEKVVLK